LDASRGTYRRYSDADRARALATLDANAGDCARTARELGIPRQTLQLWALGRVSADVPELRLENRQTLADRWEKVANAALDVLDRGTKDLPTKDAAVVGGIATDKMMLLRGDAPPAAAVVVIVTGPGLGDL